MHPKSIRGARRRPRRGFKRLIRESLEVVWEFLDIHRAPQAAPKTSRELPQWSSPRIRGNQADRPRRGGKVRHILHTPNCGNSMGRSRKKGRMRSLPLTLEG